MRGIPVILYNVMEAGVDEFNRPKLIEIPEIVENVLVAPLSEQEIVDIRNLTGRKAVYTLALPKGDNHIWENRKVAFLGQTYKTVGKVIGGIEELVPTDWHKKIRCEVYGGD